MRKIYILSISFAALLIASCTQKAEKIENISQLHDKKICVLTGSAGDIVARKTFPKAQFLDMVGSADAGLAVKTGKADAFIYDENILRKILDKNPELTILDESISKLEVAIAVKKNNDLLISQINSALHKLRNDGKLNELKNKWIVPDYIKPPTVPAQSGKGKKGILRMGTCSIFEPYTFIAEGKLVGYDIELSILLGEFLGKEIEIIDMGFDALIPSLQTGKIDFALSNFTITEERKKLISYTDPYLVNDILALVKK